MAPVKFEEDIKRKLEERQIEPSQEAWTRLSDRLDKDKHSGRNRFWLLSIAAGFLLILFTVIQVVRSPEETIPEDNYAVESPADNKVQDDTVTDATIPFETNTDLVQGTVEAEEVQKSDSKSTTVSEKLATHLPESDVASSDQKDMLNEHPKDSDKMEITKLYATNELDESLIQEVLQDTQTTSENQLDRETDSLLKAAQKELLMDKTMVERTTLAQANELLMEVEEEVEPSLKSRVYEVFKDGYKKVKTVVAQRNN
jgi:hypothetical protein